MHVRTPSVGTLGGLQTAPVVVKGPRREWRKPKPMMNGLKKSDEAVRPVRAANKGARASAESPEERASTKGNPDCQSTRRTQCRVSVPQAAARIRKAAERNPKERLTALFHHITPDALGAAYFALKKDAAAGVDGVTWDMYGEGLVRQANWQKVGGASPPERRSNRTTFLREPCVGSREGAGEASVAAWMGRAIEHRKSDGPGCRGFQIGRRQYCRRRFGEMSASPAVSENPCTFARLLLGPWEVFKLPRLS